MVVNRRSGFTLIEVLIVVVIMAILAATIIPQFSISTQDAKDSQRDFNIRALQSQIQLYEAEHVGSYPTIRSASLPQLTSKTDSTGTVDSSGELGPYVLSIPPNPYTHSAKVSASTDGSETNGGGWLYDAATGRIWADSKPPAKQ